MGETGHALRAAHECVAERIVEAHVEALADGDLCLTERLADGVVYVRRIGRDEFAALWDEGVLVLAALDA